VAVPVAVRFSSRCASVQRPAPTAVAGSHINTGDSLCRALRCAVIRGRAKWLKTDYESAALTAELRAPFLHHPTPKELADIGEDWLKEFKSRRLLGQLCRSLRGRCAVPASLHLDLSGCLVPPCGTCGAQLECSPCWASAAAMLPALTEFALVW